MWYQKLYKSDIKNIKDFDLPPRSICKAEILLSIYNNEEHIKDCLDSILPQLNDEIKLVILDDKSTDKSLLLVKKLIKDYKNNITLIINNNNLGLSMNLFRLINSSNAVFCFRMDSDDIAISNRFETQLEFMKENQYIDILGSQAFYINEKNQIVGQSNKPTTNKYIRNDLYRNPLIHPTVVLRVKKIKSIGNYSYHYPHGQDYELWMRAAYFNLKFANLKMPLIKYRICNSPKYRIKTLLYELMVSLFWLPKLKSNAYKYLIIIGRFFYRSIIYLIKIYLIKKIN